MKFPSNQIQINVSWQKSTIYRDKMKTNNKFVIWRKHKQTHEKFQLILTQSTKIQRESEIERENKKKKKTSDIGHLVELAM